MIVIQKVFINLVASSAIATFFIIWNLSFQANEIASSTQIYLSKPQEHEILVDNLIWQVLETSKGFVKLLNAYLDTRFHKTVVKINANGPKLQVTKHQIYCQFWFDDDIVPKVVQSTEYFVLWSKEAIKRLKVIPFMIVCPLDSEGKIPVSVSLTIDPLDRAENNLKIIDIQPQNNNKSEFGVCVKQITFENRDFAIRLIEWVHLLRILGVSKIHFYNRFVHPETFKAMKYFEKKGYIEVNTFLEPSEVPDKLHTPQARTLEINMLNDCFYKHRNIYDYIAILDPDEVIVPTNPNDTHWNDLFKSIPKEKERKKQDFYHFRSITFHPKVNETVDGIPEYHYMLQHVQRSTTFKEQLLVIYEGKSLVNPKRVTSVNQHGATKCNEKGCSMIVMPEKKWQVNHYRDSVLTEKENITTRDTSVWKFKDRLVREVEETLKELKFFV